VNEHTTDRSGSRRRPNRKHVTLGLGSGVDPEMDARLTVHDPDPVERLHFADRVRRALRVLPSKRRLVTARFLAGYSDEEIAAELGMTPGAVRAAHCRGRGDLQRLLADLAPVIIFVLVLGLLLTLLQLRGEVPPVRPLPILPRSQSGLFLDPMDQSDVCLGGPVTAFSPADMAPVGLSLTVDPTIRATASNRQFVATVIITNDSAPFATFEIEAVRLGLSPVKGAGGIEVSAWPAITRVTLAQGGVWRLALPVTMDRCSNLSLGGQYLMQAEITWTASGANPRQLSSPTVAIRLPNHVASPLFTAHASCVDGQADGSLFFDLFHDFNLPTGDFNLPHPAASGGFNTMELHISFATFGQVPDDAGDILLPLLITNISDRPRTLYVSDTGLISARPPGMRGTAHELGASQVLVVGILLSTRCAGSRQRGSTTYSVGYTPMPPQGARPLPRVQSTPSPATTPRPEPSNPVVCSPACPTLVHD
jgi:hypothetical protein